MKKFLLLMLFMVSSIAAWSIDGEEFVCETVEGIGLTFKVISEAEKTCETGIQSSLPSQGTVTIPSTANGYKVIGVGYRSFRGFAVKSVSIPSSVTYINNEAFENCYSLTSVNIPNNVTLIGHQAFKECGISSITIPGSVNTIGDEAFRECTNLTKVIIQEGVETISEGMFSNCTNLATVNSPSTITSIGAGAFTGTAWVTNLPGGLTYVGKVAYKYNDISGTTSVTIKDGTKSIYRYAFNGSNVTSIDIPYSLTSIGEYAFQNCYSLTTITRTGFGSAGSVFMDKVETIGDYAFYGCRSIESVSLPTTWKTICKGLFYGCTGLTSVSIPSAVTVIGPSAFSQCTNLTTINAPVSLITIGSNAFSNCSNLTTFTIPQSVTSIGGGAFLNCKKLDNIIIPNGITSINNRTFDGCESLSSINLPEGITTIGISAFSGCKGLTEITIPGSLRTMETWDNCWAFSGCTGLKKITIQEGAAVLGWNSFSGCYNVESVVVYNKTPISVYDSFKDLAHTATLYVPKDCIDTYAEAYDWKDFKEIIEIPGNTISFKDAEVREICLSKWDTNGDGFLSTEEAAVVTEIETSLFYQKRAITSFDELQFFTGLKSIGESAFFDCQKLSSISIPNSVNAIGKDAFWQCPIQTVHIFDIAAWCNIKFDGNLLNNCDHLFLNDEEITNLIIPSGVTTISNKAFLNFKGLTSVTMPDDVKEIGFQTFAGCSNLSSVVLSSSLEAIGSAAFRGCSKLTSLTIPNSVSSIGSEAFRDCGLTSIVLSNHLDKLESGVFQSCPLSSISIPSSVTSLGSKLFKDCKKLEAIYISDLAAWCRIVTNGDIQYAVGHHLFLNEEEITDLVIPSSVTNVENNSFMYCNSLTSVTIPSSVTSIGSSAFRDCSGLTSVTISNSVTDIGYSSFNGCSNLTSVTVDIKNPLSITSSTFSNRTNATLYVPVGCADDYKAADYWKEFKEIVEYVPVNLEYGEIKPDELGVTGEGTVLAAGTVLCETQNIVCKTGAEDTYRPQPVQVSIDGVEISGGIQGNTNPHDEDDGTPATTLKQPTSGAFLQFEAKADGFLYVAINASSNKAYTVFENGTAIGYAFSAIGNQNPLPEVYSYTLTGTGEQNQLLRPIGFAEQEYLRVANPEAYEARWVTENDERKWNVIKAQGTGVIAFAVHNGSSYIVNANGSKISAGGYYFDETNEVTVKSGDVPIFTKDTWTQNTIDNTLVAEKDWSGVTDEELPWIQFAEPANGSAEGSADGIAITVDTKGEIWQPQAIVFPDEATLQKYHSYKVIITAKIPADGQIQASLGSWGINEYCTKDATASNDFQDIEFVFEAFPDNIEDGHVLFQNGDILGTSIVKHVKVIDLGIISADLTYEYHAEDQTATLIQNPGRKYYGAVNVPATVTHEGGIYTVTKIDDDAFADCTKLTSVSIPASVTELRGWSFRNCTALSEITVDQDNEVYSSPENSNAIIEKTSNRLVVGCETTVIPNTVTTIGRDAFWGRWGMTSMGIPESVTTIEGCAFAYSGLRSIILPKNVTTIEGGAFVDCELETVTVESPVPPTGLNEETFSKRQNTTLIVPLGSEAAYRSADYWKEFKTITSGVANAIYADAQTGNVGRPFTMDIKLKNENSVRAYSFDLQLPEGVTIAKNDEGDYEIELSGRHDSYTPTVNYEGSTNTYKLATTSRVVGNDGVIMTLRLQVSDQTPTGETAIRISNAIYTQAENYQSVHMPEFSAKLTIGEKTYIKGDANDDDDVDIADVVCVVNYAVKINTPKFIKKAADVTGDNEVDVSDAAKLIDYIIGEIETLDPAAARSLSMARAASRPLSKTRSIDPSTLNDALYAGDLIVTPGIGSTLTISLKNALETNGYSFDLILPDGVTLAKDGNGKYICGLSSRHDNSHELHINYKEATRTYSVAVYSQSSEVLSSNDGEVMTFTLIVTDAMSYAGATASIQNAKYSKTDGSGKVTLPREEVKLSRNITMSDVMKAMSYILGENPDNFNVTAADMNGDGEVTITDVLMLIDIITKQQQ